MPLRLVCWTQWAALRTKGTQGGLEIACEIEVNWPRVTQWTTLCVSAIAVPPFLIPGPSSLFCPEIAPN